MSQTSIFLRLHTLYIAIAVSLAPAALYGRDDLFDIKKLEDFGTQKYKMTWIDIRSMPPVEHERGTMVLSTTKSKDSISLENLTRMYMPDGKRFIEYQAKCVFSTSNKPVSLRSLIYKVTRSDKVILFESRAKIEKGKIIETVIEGGKESTQERKWTDGTYPDLAVFFLVPQLPAKNGKVVQIEKVMTFPSSPQTPVESRRITSLGIDQNFKIDGQGLAKFVNSAAGEPSGINYWVDSKGLLRRVLLNSENRLDLITD